MAQTNTLPSRRASRLLLMAALCSLTSSCLSLSDNMPLNPPAAFVTATSTEQAQGVFEIDVDMTYWKSAAPFFVFGFARSELSNREAKPSDFTNMWDRDWTRLEPVNNGRPKAQVKHRNDDPKTYLNFYVIGWESTTSDDLAQYRFYGSAPANSNVDRLKLNRFD